MQQLNKKIKVVLGFLFLNAPVFSQSSAIFKGGSGDGWASQNYVQPRVSIFKGGSGDGWASQNYEQPRANIFKGGNGDGWNSGYSPMGPLSGALAKFAAQKLTGNSAIVTWKTSAGVSSPHFEVERSNDAVSFASIGRVSAENLSGENNYEFTDDQPLKGANYYRLKQAGPDGKITYSPARLVQFDNEVNGPIKYYPNPTTGILYIEIPGKMLEEAVVINISNAAGVVVDQLRFPSNERRVLTIDLKRFARGVYFIHVKTNTTNSSQRLILQ